MLIRYHLFYYALACLLFVFSQLLHPLFYIALFFYLLWIGYRFDHRYVFICILLCLILSLWQMPTHQLPSQIEGKVVKVAEKYCIVQTQNESLKLYHQEDLHYGDFIKATIEPLEMNENTNDNAFNEKLYLYSQHVFYKAQLVEIGEKTSANGLYQYLEKHFASQQDIQDYQRLFLLGEKSDSVAEDYQQFSTLSIVHLFALSGMHIHMLVYAIEFVLGYFLKEFPKKIITYGLIGFYIFHIPMNISLYRAYFVLVLGDIFKHYLNDLDVLSLLVIVSLVYNPYLIFHSSFVFSYFVYLMILLTKNLPHSSLLVSISTIPIVLNMQYQWPILMLVLGSLWEPFISFLYFLCWVTLFLPFFLPAMNVSVILMKYLLEFLMAINQVIMFSKPNFLFYLFFYLCFAWIVYCYGMKQSVKKPALAILSLMLVFSFYSQNKIYGEVTMIDVGQGDCTLIRLPMNQGNILIDTGGNKDYDLATKVIIPYLKSIGVHQLDYVYISHDDFDHAGALDSLKENFPVKQVIDSYEAKRDIGCMQVEMLKPSLTYTDNNDKSLIMKVTLPTMTLLFTGDMSKQVEEDIYQKYGKMDIDVLKVSHHGSQTATSSALLQMIQPSIAMIGVKKNNMYHHPSNEVIERLKRKNVYILRTDQDGMFHVRFYAKSRYIFK